jgi:hypothetical protein
MGHLSLLQNKLLFFEISLKLKIHINLFEENQLWTLFNDFFYFFGPQKLIVT